MISSIKAHSFAICSIKSYDLFGLIVNFPNLVYTTLDDFPSVSKRRQRKEHLWPSLVMKVKRTGTFLYIFSGTQSGVWSSWEESPLFQLCSEAFLFFSVNVQTDTPQKSLTTIFYLLLHFHFFFKLPCPCIFLYALQIPPWLLLHASTPPHGSLPEICQNV